MVELHHLLLLPPATGADLEHCLMKLLAAPSTSETELSLPLTLARRWPEGLLVGTVWRCTCELCYER